MIIKEKKNKFNLRNSLKIAGAVGLVGLLGYTSVKITGAEEFKDNYVRLDSSQIERMGEELDRETHYDLSKKIKAIVRYSQEKAKYEFPDSSKSK